VPKSDPDYLHIEQTYDEGSADYSEHFQQAHKFVEPERQEFLRSMPARAKVLDCGCGPGFDTENFARMGYKVTAIDLSEKFVMFTKKRVPQAQVLKMDMRALDFSDGSFDGIWASFSLLHIRAADIEQTLAGFKRLLRASGILAAALHRGAKTAWVKTIISGMERDTFVQEWLQSDIEGIVRNSGFNILSSRAFLREGGRHPLLGIVAQI
jgi:ubiquinone/menaquinone biosynthesis C-methylase UbiE